MPTFEFTNLDQFKQVINTLAPQTPILVTLKTDQMLTHRFVIDNKISDSEIMQFLTLNSEKFFGCIADELALDYKKISDFSETQNNLIAIAAHRNLIHDIQMLCDARRVVLSGVSDEAGSPINFLPWRLQLKKKRRQQLCCRLIGYAAIFFIFALLLKMVFKNHLRKSTQQTSVLKNQLHQIPVAHTQTHQQLLNKLNKINSEKKLACVSNRQSTHLFFEIATALPSVITLTSLTETPKQLTIQGISTTLADIHKYVARLQKKMQWKSATLSDIHVDSQNKNQMLFTLKVVP